MPYVESALVPVVSGSRRSSSNALRAAGSAIPVLSPPGPTTALTRLDPSTAPMPPRPATPSRFFQYVARHAKRTRRSPAGPIAITSVSAPSVAWMAWTVSRVVLPQSESAGFTSTPASPTFK